MKGRESVDESREPVLRTRADCTVDAAGDIHFTIAGAAESAARLLLRRRGSSGDRLWIVLEETGKGSLRAVLPLSSELAEGRWNVYVRTGGETPVRLASGHNDVRVLIDCSPAPCTSPVRVRIPYATAEGDLSLSVWRRAPHAEAGDIRVADGVLTIRGRLFGAPLSTSACLEARIRGTDRPEGTAVAVPVVAQGPDFTVVLPYEELVGHGAGKIWDLWLRPERGAEPVRMARILDDIPLKKKIFTYPALSLESGAPLAARAYYTTDNDLSVAIKKMVD